MSTGRFLMSIQCACISSCVGVLFSRRCLAAVYDDAADSNSPSKGKCYCALCYSYLVVNTSKKVSPHYCPAMDTKKLKKRGNLKKCEFKKGNRDPEKSN